MLIGAAATAIPAAATVEFLNHAQSGSGTPSVGLPAPASRTSAPTTGSPSTPATATSSAPSGTVASVHIPAGLGDDGGGGDGGGGDDGGFRQVARSRKPVLSSPAATSAASGSSTAVPHGAAKNGSFTGSVVSDPFGTVQTSITVSGGKIVAVNASAPMGNPLSSTINQQAVPILKSETLQAQSANVNLVSGATLTSQAYVQSLQSALTQANL